jgi:hypothetical protein
MVAEIQQALDTYPREQLQEILAYLFKEYVVEGAVAPAKEAAAMLEARSELEGLSFAELVTWLQLHLDVPELAQFEVQNERVSVRAGGRTIAIEARQQAGPAAAPAPVAAPTTATVTAPTVASSPALASPPAPIASTSTPTTTASGQASEGKKEEPPSRFSWLEVD